MEREENIQNNVENTNEEKHHEHDKMQEIYDKALLLGIQSQQGKEAYAKLHQYLEPLPDLFKPQRVREGKGLEKLALIGQYKVRVDLAASALRRCGFDVETFEVTPRDWEETMRYVTYYNLRYGRKPLSFLPSDVLMKQRFFQRNYHWIQYVSQENYMVLDLGNCRVSLQKPSGMCADDLVLPKKIYDLSEILKNSNYEELGASLLLTFEFVGYGCEYFDYSLLYYKDFDIYLEITLAKSSGIISAYVFKNGGYCFNIIDYLFKKNEKELCNLLYKIHFPQKIIYDLFSYIEKNGIGNIYDDYVSLENLKYEYKYTLGCIEEKYLSLFNNLGFDILYNYKDKVISEIIFDNRVFYNKSTGCYMFLSLDVDLGGLNVWFQMSGKKCFSLIDYYSSHNKIDKYLEFYSTNLIQEKIENLCLILKNEISDFLLKESWYSFFNYYWIMYI